MAMKRLFRSAQISASGPYVCMAEDCAQSIHLAQRTLQHILGYRQISRWATEAGGQLFGQIEKEQVKVICATGPYRGDERSRYRYRSHPAEAQWAIETKAKEGLLYLGEWHTHAEDFPNASDLDNDAMSRLITNSKLNSNGLLMLIVGRAPTPEGLALISISEGKIRQWSVQQQLASDSAHVVA